MTEFLIAIALFVVAHVVPPLPAVRARLIARIGRRAYLLAYSLVSIALIVWIIAAAKRAPYVALWDPAPWQALVPILVMPFATWLLFAGLVEPNPLSISLLAPKPDAEVGPAAAVTRHPVLWAFLLWAASHVVPNGNVVSLILFGGTALLALAGLMVLDRRARQRLGDARWHDLAAPTSMIPFAALLAGRARLRVSMRLVLSLAVAVAAYAWFLLVGHALLIGPDPLAWIQS